jgi:hypothetical protein
VQGALPALVLSWEAFAKRHERQAYRFRKLAGDDRHER